MTPPTQSTDPASGTLDALEASRAPIVRVRAVCKSFVQGGKSVAALRGVTHFRADADRS